MEKSEYERLNREARDKARERRIDLLLQLGWNENDAADYAGFFQIQQNTPLLPGEIRRCQEYEKKYEVGPDFVVFTTQLKPPKGG